MLRMTVETVCHQFVNLVKEMCCELSFSGRMWELPKEKNANIL